MAGFSAGLGVRLAEEGEGFDGVGFGETEGGAGFSSGMAGLVRAVSSLACLDWLR